MNLNSDYEKYSQENYQKSSFSECSQAYYYDMLECMFPERWHNLTDSLNIFFVPEAMSGTIHRCFIFDKIHDRYFTAKKSIKADNNELLKEFVNEVF